MYTPYTVIYNYIKNNVVVNKLSVSSENHVTV